VLEKVVRTDPVWEGAYRTRPGRGEKDLPLGGEYSDCPQKDAGKGNGKSTGKRGGWVTTHLRYGKAAAGGKAAWAKGRGGEGSEKNLAKKKKRGKTAPVVVGVREKKRDPQTEPRYLERLNRFI